MPINSGGSLWAWDSPKTIVTLTMGIVLVLVFITIEGCVAKIPIIPLRLFKQRSPSLLLLTGILHDFVWQTTQYFVPLYFQGVRGYTPFQSATLILPFIVAQGLAGAASGPVMSKLARYVTTIALRTLLYRLCLRYGADTLLSCASASCSGPSVLV